MADTEKKTAKYRFLVDTIKEKIKNGEYEPGERMESENTLSEQFGYSRQTVRQALSVLEQEGLIERRRGSGTYISSESRRTPRGNSIAIVTTYISDYIFPTIIRGIEETLTNAGYDLTLNVTNNHVEEEARILQSLISRRVDGVIVEGTKTAFPNPNVELYRRLEKMGVPVVFFNSYYRDLPDSVYVVTDDRKAGLQAVDLLIEKGCRRVGGVFKSDDMQGHGRYAGFSEGLIHNGCVLGDDNVVWYTTAERSRLFRPDNSDYMFERLRGCDGIVCYNDQIAYGVIDLLQKPVSFQRCRSLRHLHQRNDPLLHPGSSGTGENNYRKFFFCSTFHRAGDLLPHNMSHAGHHKTAVADTKHGRIAVD